MYEKVCKKWRRCARRFPAIPETTVYVAKRPPPPIRAKVKLKSFQAVTRSGQVILYLKNVCDCVVTTVFK